MSDDKERQIKIAWIKQREKAGLSFIEIVNAYNATFGTSHFAEVLGNPALPGKKRSPQQFARDVQDVFLGDGLLGF